MRTRLPLLLAAGLFCATQAHAEAKKNWELSGELDLVSDYRFRGVSLSDLDPAVQPIITLSHKSGFYVNAWGSNIARTEGGAHVELDLAGGFEWERGKTSLDLSVTYYTNPGDSALNYAEASAVLTYDAGAFKPRVGFSYIPPQSATRRETGAKADNVYLTAGADFDIPHTPITISGEVGYERGFFDYNDHGGKFDWQIGATVRYRGVGVRLSYVDSSVHVRDGGNDLAKAAVLAQLSFSFGKSD